MFALEDLHWMDDASLQFARACSMRSGGAARGDAASDEPGATRAGPAGTWRWPREAGADTLAPDEIVEWWRRLGARTIPVAVKDLIVAKAEGNPFYSEEIAIALREGGVIVIEDGECQIAVTQELSTLNLQER